MLYRIIAAAAKTKLKKRFNAGSTAIIIIVSIVGINMKGILIFVESEYAPRDGIIMLKIKTETATVRPR